MKMFRQSATNKPERNHRTLSEWVQIVEGLHPKNIEMGLERIRVVKERLGIHFDCPVIIVGGTNGKGSTSAMLQTIYREAGYKTGLYSSPHIHFFNERMKIDGEMVDDETLVRYFEVIEEVRGDVPLTFFEFTTLVALKLYADAQLDVLVLEVGLGGRLDAVNLIDADVSIVTNVAIDHIDYLGDTREKIGFEKAGIYRQGQSAFYGDLDPPESLLKHAASVGANLKVFGRDYRFETDGGHWNYLGEKSSYAGLVPPSLKGDTQIHNATTVVAAVEALQQRLPVDAAAIGRGIVRTELPGRFQILQDEPSVILDVAHNPHAAAVLAKNLKDMGSFHATHAVFGAMSDKDIDGVIELMKGCVDRWYVTDLPLPRAATAQALKQKLISAGVTRGKTNQCISVYHNAVDAMTSAKNNAQKNDRIVAFGSFWVVTGVTEEGDLKPTNHR